MRSRPRRRRRVCRRARPARAGCRPGRRTRRRAGAARPRTRVARAQVRAAGRDDRRARRTDTRQRGPRATRSAARADGARTPALRHRLHPASRRRPRDPRPSRALRLRGALTDSGCRGRRPPRAARGGPRCRPPVRRLAAVGARQRLPVHRDRDRARTAAGHPRSTVRVVDRRGLVRLDSRHGGGGCRCSRPRARRRR